MRFMSSSWLIVPKTARTPAVAVTVAAVALLLLALGLPSRPCLAADELDYSAADPELRVVRLDSAERDSFLAVRGDGAGRIFVGGRKAVFVYEPDDRGGYRPRQKLLELPEHTWVGDIAVRGDDLYLLTVSALYVVPGGVTRRDGLRPERLLWGVPLGHVHQCFHALAWGPEGDLYLSMGDPLWYYGDFDRPDHWGHWTFFSGPDGTKTPYTGVGGVFRCAPDGSRLQVVARGLRNACGLAFDRDWNLFSNDNDHESLPDQYVPGRLLHVTPHADFAWPRGWMPEKTPQRADLLETIFAGMGRAVPVGQAYYGDTFLPEKYRGNLLLARWGIRAVTRYPLRRRGASFQAEEEKLLVGRDQARPVGVCVGRGGRVFVTVAYMAHNEGSPSYKSDLVMITRADDPATHPFQAYDAATAEPGNLFAELSNPSWSFRYVAHTELLARGGEVARQAVERLGKVSPDDPAAPHLIWLGGAASRKYRRTTEVGLQSLTLLTRFADHANPGLRLQAVRALAEFFPNEKESREVFLKALADNDPQVVQAAVLAFFQLGEPPDAVVSGPAVSKDTYLRQPATLLLAEKASPDRIADLCRSKDPATRLAGTLAAGFRLTLPPATKPIPDDLPLTPQQNPQEAYVIQYADAKIDLRTRGRLGNFTVAEHWKAGKHTAEQERLFSLLQGLLDDADEPVRLQAAHFLLLLRDPRTEAAVAKVRRAGDERRLAAAPIKTIGKVWLAGPFPDGKAGFQKAHPPEQGPIDLSAGYDTGEAKVTWQEMKPAVHYDLGKQFGKCDYSSFYAFFRLESPARDKALLLVGSDDGVKVWHNGREVWANDVVRGALPFQDVVLLDLQPGSNDVLVRVRNETGDCGLYLHYRTQGNVTAVLPEKLGTALLAERLKAAAGAKEAGVGPEFLQVDWEKAVGQGDAARGRQLFGSLGCVKCHAITADAQSGGGPSLAETRKRFTVPYIVESILLPSKQVSPVFRATHVELKSGQVLTGLVVSETADKLELLLPDTTRKTIAKSEIEERRILEQSPMPQGLVKTPEELRDLLAYLLSEKPDPP
jgi:putative heme-binding domain-containing protein